MKTIDRQNTLFVLVALVLYFTAISLACANENATLKGTILNLINEARTNPSEFLETYREEINNHEPKFVAILERAEPIEEVIWDDGLHEMTRQIATNQHLDPDYNGNNDLCGFAGPTSTGYLSTCAVKYVCDVYTNINNPDYSHIGLHFEPEAYCLRWGISCERRSYDYALDIDLDTTIIDFDRINTADNTSYLTKDEKEMVQEINMVRAYPKAYANIISRYLARAANHGILDKDELDAGLELIDELRTHAPVRILTPHTGVYRSSKRHGKDCERRGFIDHTGSDGTDPWDRILPESDEFHNGNENLVAGGGNPRLSVIMLLIDDGISSRGHRYNMLDPEWKWVGVYKHKVKSGGYTMEAYVQNFAN